MNNKKNGLRLLLIALLLVLISWGVYQCDYQYSYWQDYQQRPWAYSRDKNAKLLVGEWQGKYTDPNGVAKTIELQISEPLTDKERRKQAGRKRRRRSRGGRNTTGFEGVATVRSKMGTEHYIINGGVDKADYHQIKLNFRAEDEKKRLQPNFCLNLAESGQWQEDGMVLKSGFAYFKKDGSSFSDSADPRYDYIATINLKRK
jgi:hypothetical protein